MPFSRFPHLSLGVRMLSIAAVAFLRRAPPLPAPSADDGEHHTGSPTEAGLALNSDSRNVGAVDAEPDGQSDPLTAWPAPLSDAVMRQKIRQAVRRIGPTEFDVDSAIVREILEGDTGREVSRTVPQRVVAEWDGGQFVGQRLLGIRPGSLCAALGMKSGDRLDIVNGTTFPSPEAVLEAYGHLRTARRMTLLINRNGHPITLEYNLK